MAIPLCSKQPNKQGHDKVTKLKATCHIKILQTTFYSIVRIADSIVRRARKQALRLVSGEAG